MPQIGTVVKKQAKEKEKMENVSNDYQQEQESRSPEVIEVYDLFLTDGTHLRFNSSSQDLQLVDFEE